MVLADRTVENVRNGRRSRGPSPNGHSIAITSGAGGGGGITESSSDDENSRKNGNSSKATKAKSEYEEKIRVGRDYQAVCPEMVPMPERKPEQMNDRALLVWSPTKEIPDNKLEEYITVAKEKYGYNGEQALGMLFWHKHDLERAVLDLANFTPFPDEWTVEDKVLFEQAFQFHGKSFHRIRQMLPDKSIASLVKFYYSWKKTRSRTSVMDRQEKMKKNDSSENGSDHGSNDDSDNDDKPSVATVANATSVSTPNNTANGTDSTDTKLVAPTDLDGSSGVRATAAPGVAVSNGNSSAASTMSLNCSGCGVTCSELNTTPQGKLCGSCYHHWRRTGVLRPTSGPTFMNKRARNSNLLGKSGDSHKRRPPRGMYINHDDIVKLANSAQTTTSTDSSCSLGSKPSDDLLAGMDREIVSLWSQIQLNKQCVSRLKGSLEKTSEVIQPTESQVVRLTSRWNNEELLLAVQGVRKYGRNFQAIADTLGTKTEAQLRTFFVNYRRKYNLDNIIKEYETEQKLFQEQMNSNNKEDDSLTTISELESVDTNSNTGDKYDLIDEKKFSGKKSVVDTDITEIDLIDDEVVSSGKKVDTGDILGGSVSTANGSGGLAATSSLPTGSITAANASLDSAITTDSETAMDVDQFTPNSKLADSGSSTTIVIK